MDLRTTRNRKNVFNAMVNHFNRIASKNNNNISLIDIWNVEDFIQKKFKLNDRQVSLITDKVFEQNLLRYNSKPLNLTSLENK